MLNHFPASRCWEAARIWLCVTTALSVVLLSTIGVASAQNFVGGVVQQNAIPVMQQNGEVILEYYYPVVEQQFYLPLPQQAVNQPPQIGFPTPQPRFLPSGPLYLDPTLEPPPQSNIYGEVIIGEFEETDSASRGKQDSKTPEQKAADKDKDPVQN